VKAVSRIRKASISAALAGRVSACKRIPFRRRGAVLHETPATPLRRMVMRARLATLNGVNGTVRFSGSVGRIDQPVFIIDDARPEA
jgi:hypothetical protein